MTDRHPLDGTDNAELLAMLDRKAARHLGNLHAGRTHDYWGVDQQAALDGVIAARNNLLRSQPAA